VDQDTQLGGRAHSFAHEGISLLSNSTSPYSPQYSFLLPFSCYPFLTLRAFECAGVAKTKSLNPCSGRRRAHVGETRVEAVGSSVQYAGEDFMTDTWIADVTVVRIIGRRPRWMSFQSDCSSLATSPALKEMAEQRAALSLIGHSGEGHLCWNIAPIHQSEITTPFSGSSLSHLHLRSCIVIKRVPCPSRCLRPVRYISRAQLPTGGVGKDPLGLRGSAL